MPDRIKAVLFDFAGTLVVPRAARELISAAAESLGLGLAPDRLDELAGAYLEAGIPGAPYPSAVPERLRAGYERRDLSPQNHRSAYVALFRTVGAHPDLAEAVYEQILRPEGWVAYADAAPVVEDLRMGGFRLGVVSNVGFDIRPILSACGLGELAGACTLSCEVGAVKPDPRIFRVALAGLGTDPGETLMVGDTGADAAAVHLGMPVLILPMTEPGSIHGLHRVSAIARLG